MNCNNNVWISLGSRSVFYLVRHCVHSEVDFLKALINTIITYADGSIGIKNLQQPQGLISFPFRSARSHKTQF